MAKHSKERTQAEAQFKRTQKAQRATESEQAMADYVAAGHAVRAKTARPFVCVERTVLTNGPLSFPKIRSGLGSPHEAETLHHPSRPDLISGKDSG